MMSLPGYVKICRNYVEIGLKRHWPQESETLTFSCRVFLRRSTYLAIGQAQTELVGASGKI